MSTPWSNATAGVWSGKLGGVASDPREGDEWCYCSSCARPTRMTGTKLCDRCWERRRHAPEADDELDALSALLADVRGSRVIGWLPVVFVPGIGGGRQEVGSLISAKDVREILERAGRLP